MPHGIDRNLKGALILFGLVGSGITSAKCPGWLQRPDVPACGQKTEHLLSDNYPALAHVVSDEPAQSVGSAENRSVGTAFAKDFVIQTLRASGDRVPMFFLPVREATLLSIRDQIRSDGTLDEGTKEKWISSLVHVPNVTPFAWQQDYFEGFSDGQGRVKMRGIERYPHGMAAQTDRLFAAMNAACDKIQKAPQIPIPPNTTNYDGLSGGNIEALPGGICMRGDNQPETFTGAFCSPKDRVQLDVSWLEVGHIDELVGVVKTPGNHPCNFAITVSSPKKAIELLRNEANADKPFLSAFHPSLSNPTGESIHNRRAKRLCNLLGLQRYLGDPTSKKKSKEELPPHHKPAIQKRHQSLLEWLFKPAWAQGKNGTPATVSPCASLTNRDIAERLKDGSPLRVLNELAAEAMEKNKVKIRAKLSERLPQCPVRFIEVPDLFIGDVPVEKDGADPSLPLSERFALVRGANRSLFPSPTNGVAVAGTQLIPHPQNPVFAEELRAELSKNGVASDFVDTFDYGHVGKGNLHCATHTLRYCR